MSATLTWGDLGTQFDGPHATPERRTEGPYFLNIASLNSGRLDLAASDRVSDEDFRRWSRRVTPRPDDLLFSYETRLGEAALMPGGINACLGRRMALLRPDTRVVDPRFLLYFYLSPGFQRTIAERTIHGATVSRISLLDMPTWPVEIPKLSVQQAIAEVLGALDDKITANTRVELAVSALAQAEFQRWTASAGSNTKSLGELVSERLLDLGDGYRTKRSEQGIPGLRILRAGDVRDGHALPTGSDFVSERLRDAMGNKVSKVGDLVLTTKGTVGRLAVMSPDVEEVIYSPQLCYFRATGTKFAVPYLAAYFQTHAFFKQLQQRMDGSDMAPYVSLFDLRSVRVPWSDLESINDVGLRQGIYVNALHKVASESRALAMMRDQLLPLLMSGKVRVKDAEKVVEGLV